MNLDGIQAAVLHPEAELFVDFSETVLLQAIVHAQASACAAHIAMLNGICFSTHLNAVLEVSRLLARTRPDICRPVFQLPSPLNGERDRG